MDKGINRFCPKQGSIELIEPMQTEPLYYISTALSKYACLQNYQNHLKHAKLPKLSFQVETENFISTYEKNAFAYHSVRWHLSTYIIKVRSI